MRTSNIVLIGFMGSGKTTVGKIISEQANMLFVDTDEIVTRRVRMTIPYIFSEYGESYFRALEADAIRSSANMRGAVIATGGGAVLRDENTKALRRTGRVFYLAWPPEDLYKHTQNDETRPLLRKAERLTRICELLAQRNSFYINASDCVIDCTKKNPNTIADEILGEDFYANIRRDSRC